MSGASHVAIAGAAENQEGATAENKGQQPINPATGEPIGAADKPDAPEKPAGEEQPTVDAGKPKKVPSNAHAGDGAEEVETEGTFLGLNGHDWAVGGIGVAVGAAIVGGVWALCSGD